MNSLAVAACVAATTITRLAQIDDKSVLALSLDLAGKVVTVLDCGIEDLLEVVEEAQIVSADTPKTSHPSKNPRQRKNYL